MARKATEVPKEYVQNIEHVRSFFDCTWPTIGQMIQERAFPEPELGWDSEIRYWKREKIEQFAARFKHVIGKGGKWDLLRFILDEEKRMEQAKKS